MFGLPNIPVNPNEAQLPTKLNVHIKSMTTTFYEGPASSLSAANTTGEFDILALHANFITLIERFVILDKRLPTEKKFDIKSAVLSVFNGRVDIYVGI
jgi:F0F1-type ATP synthase epsilon subunit